MRADLMMDYMVQYPTNTAIYPPNVLLLLCLLEGKLTL